MSQHLFEESQDPYLQEIFSDMRRKGARWAITARTGAAALLGVWLFSASSAPLYHLMLLFLFVGMGFVYLALSHSAYYQSWQAYFMVFSDACVLTLALLYQPGENALPLIYLTGQGFLYYFALLGLSVLLYIPALIIWAAFANVLAWTLGQVLFVATHSAIIDSVTDLTRSLPLEIFLMLLCGGAIGTAFWQLRYAMYRQIIAEREFYDILISERANRSEPGEEVYIDDLTGLGTRAAYDRDSAQFTKVFYEGRLTDLTIAIIDLEGVDKVIENRGIEEQDRLLRLFSQSMRRVFRSSDMAYRFGSDQFALLAPGSSMNNAERLRNLLQNIIAQVKEQGFPEIQGKMGLYTLHEVQKNAETPQTGTDNDKDQTALAG